MKENFVAETMSSDERKIITLNGVKMERKENGEYQAVEHRHGSRFNSSDVFTRIVLIPVMFLAVFFLCVSFRMSIVHTDEPASHIEDVSEQVFAEAAAEGAEELSGKPWTTKADAAAEEDWENPHTVTVSFWSYDGSKLCPSIVKRLEPGEYFEIFVPTVNGYIPICDSVKGAMGGHNVEYVVYYKAA